MFERLSSAYYVGNLYIEPGTGPHPVMQREQHAEVNATVYATGYGVERLDIPLVMRLDNVHFPVFADQDVQEGTLELPDSILDSTTISHPPTLREVLLASAERAGQLLEWFTPYEIAPSAAVP